jgi:hypothetical protein
MDSIAKIVHFLRDLDLRKSPSIAETIDWAQALIHLGITQIDEDVLKQTLPVLLKYQEDLQLIKSKYREMIRLGNM